MCGLDIGPKRPWIDLKEPTKVMLKFNRNIDVKASTDIVNTAIAS